MNTLVDPGASEVRGHSPSFHQPGSSGRVHASVGVERPFKLLSPCLPHTDWKSERTKHIKEVLAWPIRSSSLYRRIIQWLPPGDNDPAGTTSKSSDLQIKDLLHRTTKAAHSAPCKDDSKALHRGELQTVIPLSLEGLSTIQRLQP